MEEVKDLFIGVLEISVHVTTVERFKTYGKQPGPVRVRLAPKDDVVLVLQNKSKLADYENLDRIHIEMFNVKADVIKRDSWNTSLRLLNCEVLQGSILLPLLFSIYKQPAGSPYQSKMSSIFSPN